MLGNRNPRRFILTAAIAVVCMTATLRAQAQSADAAPPASNRQLTPSQSLRLRQEQVTDKFHRFEEVLLRMAELSAAEDPERAALLRRVAARSTQQLVGVQFERLIELLAKDQLSETVRNQEDLLEDLRSLLRLMLSEDRARRMETEKARIQALVKRINQLIREEKTIRAETEKGADTDQLAERQGKLAERTGKLAEEMQGSGSPEGDPNENEAEGKDPSSQDSEKQDSEGEGDEEAEGEGEGKPEGEPSESQEPSQGQGQGGTPQGEPQEGEDRAQNNLEAAQQRMQAAQENLEKARRRQAGDEQEQALRELEQAKAELEDILRQLREEEIDRMLAWLETRFRKMLKLQIEVYEGTVRLDGIPADDRDRSIDIESSRLSRQEGTIVAEAAKVLNLLREDGTAVAFPEAVMQMSEDMQQIAQRLARTQVGDITQAIEQDVIAALEEMIAALQKAQKERDGEPPQDDSPQGPPEDPALIDALAELKMIRSLQMRVNRRTQRYSNLIEGERADTPDLLGALEDLSAREERIYRATRDIVVGRNQ